MRRRRLFSRDEEQSPPLLAYDGGAEPVASRRARTHHGMAWLLRHSWRARTSTLLGIALLVIAALLVQQFALRQQLIDVRRSADLEQEATVAQLDKVRSELERTSIDAAQIAADSAPSVLSVGVGNSFGTAFAFARDADATLLVTNRHVVAGASRTGGHVELLQGKQIIPGRVVAVSTSADVAIVRVDRSVPVLRPVEDGGLLVAEGDPVLAYGSPLGLTDTKTQGIVSAVREDFIQFDAPVNPGSSGGPLLDRDGRVLGIVTGEIAESANQRGTGLSIAVDIDEACLLVAAELPSVTACSDDG